jgi:hypothetical protein
VALVPQDLNFARQYAEYLNDDALRFMVLNRMVICLTSFKFPTDSIVARGATHAASELGRSMLRELSAADTILSERATAARLAASGEQRGDADELPASFWEVNRTDLLGTRCILLSWLGEVEEQRGLLRQLIQRADEHSAADPQKRMVHRINLLRLLLPSDPEARRLHEQVRALMPPQQDCAVCGCPLDAPPADPSLDGTHDGASASPDAVGQANDYVKVLCCSRHLAHTSCHLKWGDAAVKRMGSQCTEPWAVRERCPICLDVTPTLLIRHG